MVVPYGGVRASPLQTRSTLRRPKTCRILYKSLMYATACTCGCRVLGPSSLSLYSDTANFKGGPKTWLRDCCPFLQIYRPLISPTYVHTCMLQRWNFCIIVWSSFNVVYSGCPQCVTVCHCIQEEARPANASRFSTMRRNRYLLALPLFVQVPYRGEQLLLPQQPLVVSLGHLISFRFMGEGGTRR